MSQIRPLNKELQEFACNNLNEVETRIPDDLEALRAWLEQQPHLKARTDDQFLLAFLRFCKYNLESAEQRIDYFYTYKSSAKELLKSRHIDDKILDIAQANIFYTLPKPMGPGGPRIHVTLMCNINPSIHTVADLFRYHVMRCEIETNTDDNWNIAGVIEIVDFSKIPFALVKQFDLGQFKQMAALLEHGIPTNLMGTHIVNASREIQILLSLIKTVMKQKELLNIHPNLDSLQKAIGKEYLPVEYGGSNGTLKEAAENYEKLLMSFKTYFEEDEIYGVNEKLRKGGNVSTPSSSFRKLLNID
ncbi:alpha-tocopherol transfer protein isoform 2-T2 [Cochliomyia hominivorax]